MSQAFEEYWQAATGGYQIRSTKNFARETWEAAQSALPSKDGLLEDALKNLHDKCWDVLSNVALKKLRPELEAAKKLIYAAFPEHHGIPDTGGKQ